MNAVDQVRSGRNRILVAGHHPRIIQSVLDFDYLSSKEKPSVVGIVTANRKAHKFFFGKKELLIPCYRSIPESVVRQVDWLLNLQSGRRAFGSTVAFFEKYPLSLGAHIFAENVPEKHSTELLRRFGKQYMIAGPSGVGVLVAGHLKLGAIGGVDAIQLDASKLTSPGSTAVVSTSGGMTNELLRSVALAGKRVSFSVSVGGDRFPITALGDVLALAEEDSETGSIVYFGELGGSDEYEIVDMLRRGKLTKPILCYIAGVIDDAFDEHMQFGHAKALVARKDESARAKRDALRAAGAIVPETFPEFLSAMRDLPERKGRPRAAVRSRTAQTGDTAVRAESLMHRSHSILTTRKIVDLGAVPRYVKGGTLVKQKEHAFAASVMRALLGREVSTVTAAYVGNIFELLIDHGGHVSGAVNTMITARAGKDMVSSLASGLLTIGPRFGGAVNAAALAWLEGVESGESAEVFVERKTSSGALLSGIGHRKYRVGLPDPRVVALSEFARLLKKHPHYDFAREVEKVTTGKNGSLLLNVDGVMAALLLDVLREKEKVSPKELRELVDAEFFNALFIIPRTVGFIAHFMEQKRNDEGLFRLPDGLLFEGEKDPGA